MTRSQKRRIWIWAALAVFALLILAGGLNQVAFREAKPFRLDWDKLTQLLADMMTFDTVSLPWEGTPAIFLLIRIFLALALLTLPFAIIAFILWPDIRKRVLRDLLRLITFVFLAYMLSQLRLDRLGPGEQGALRADFPDDTFATPAIPSPEIAFTPATSEWMITVAGVSLALIFAALVIGGIWSYLQRREAPSSTLGRVAQEAEAALGALQSGADLKNAVVRCYVEMSRALNEARGVRRKRTMTVREFEARLIEIGLPGDEVRRLTRLFEAVRYGHQAPSAADEAQARASLTAIIQAAEAARPPSGRRGAT
ncbi:MAG: DUF4129 domain-containing protein [Chloroflexi bacterium]|jgi:hypothetical protein|nr:DUF4129 domain-containing protein [Chloroflexota bacterium]